MKVVSFRYKGYKAGINPFLKFTVEGLLQILRHEEARWVVEEAIENE